MRNSFVLIATSVTLSLAAVSQPIAAQTPDRADSVAHGADELKAFDIPAGRLSEALTQLARQTGAEVVYRPEQIQGLTTAGVRGELTVSDAIVKLLQGTPLMLRKDATGALLIANPQSSMNDASNRRIRLAQADAPSGTSQGDVDSLETIIVTSERLPDEYSGGQVARGSRLGLIGNRDVMETPFSTVNYTAKFLRDSGARSLAEVVVADPSVRLAGSTSRSFDRVFIRGFRFNNSSVSFDGLFGVAPPLQIAVETVERVELIKGPAALLSGMSPAGEIGGSVNLTPKRAGAKPNLQLTGTWYSESEFGAHVDAGCRFGADDQFGMRVNTVYRDGELALEGNSRETIDATVGFDFVQGGFRLSADMGYQKRDTEGVDADHYLGANVLTLPRAPAADSAHFQPWSTQVADATYGAVRAEYEIGSNALVYAGGGFGESTSRLVASYALPVQASGDFTEVFWGSATDFDSVSGEVGFRAVVDTGPIQHQLALAAMKLDREDGSLSVTSPAIVGGLISNPSNLYSPRFLERPANMGAFPRVRTTGKTVLTSYGFADTLSFSEGRALLTLGARMQQVEVQAFSAATGARTSSYDEETVSPAVGAVIKARKNLSFYGNYSQGLTQGPVAPALARNAAEAFPPVRTKQIEAGVKIDHGSFLSTLALFQIAQPSGFTDPVTLVFSMAGEQRHRGVELNTFGEPVRGFRLLGGAAYTDAELTKTAGGVNEGHVPTNISKVTASLGAEWDPPFVKGLTLTARGIYSGPFYINLANTIEAPSWTTLDLGARMGFSAGGKPVMVRLTVENALDEDYWNSAFLYRGSPRTFLMSATVDL